MTIVPDSDTSPWLELGGGLRTIGGRRGLGRLVPGTTLRTAGDAPTQHKSSERGGRLSVTGFACVAVSTSAGAIGQGERRRPIRAWARDDANLCAHNSLCAGVRMREHSYMRPCAYACPAVINDPNLGSSMLFASREPVMRRPSPCAIFVAGRAASPRCAR